MTIYHEIAIALLFITCLAVMGWFYSPSARFLWLETHWLLNGWRESLRLAWVRLKQKAAK